MSEEIILEPQPGPQEQFLSSTADIAIYGGAAGGGKSYALLLEPIRHYHNGKFGCVIFRRNSTQVRNEGGLWDESVAMYLPLLGHPNQGMLEWTFPSGMRLKFAHLEHERTIYNWQGSQIAFIGFDELTHFTEKQFFYMMSRNRSASGVPGYVRATTNPDRDSWVRKIIDWWVGEDGYPLEERSGVVRWFIRQDDEIVWGDTKEELVGKHGEDQIPKSLTFIASSIHDNKILMEADPSYLSNLMALSRVERLRLLGGNWDVRPTAGMYFQRGWFEIVKTLPAGWTKIIRYWDRAATKPSETNKNPDWTAGVKLYCYPNGQCIIAHVARIRDTPLNVERFIKNTTIQDGRSVWVYVEEDPGQAGVADADNYVRLLAGYNVRKNRASGDKITRAMPVSAQSEGGNIKVLEGPWNDALFVELENFPPEESAVGVKKAEGESDKGKDDQVDALSGAYNMSLSELTMFDTMRGN